MSEFASQLQATDLPRAVMVAVFGEKKRAETDNRVAIHTTRHAELAIDAPGVPGATTRRAVITGGLGTAPEAGGR